MGIGVVPGSKWKTLRVATPGTGCLAVSGRIVHCAHDLASYLPKCTSLD